MTQVSFKERFPETAMAIVIESHHRHIVIIVHFYVSYTYKLNHAFRIVSLIIKN